LERLVNQEVAGRRCGEHEAVERAQLSTDYLEKIGLSPDRN
jgi:hypothetical protein